MKLTRRALIALGIASVGGMGCSKSKTSVAPQTRTIASQDTVVSHDGIHTDGTQVPDKPLTRKQLDTMLEKLAKKPVQKASEIGAMCYEPRAYHTRIDYICPVCGTKTHYAEKAETMIAVDAVRFFRQQMKRIQALGVNATLDETDLCSQCRKDKTTSEINYSIVVSLDQRTVRTPFQYGDYGSELDMVIAFLEKKDVYTPSYCGYYGPLKDKYPLQPHIPRIRKILGVDE